MQKPLEIDYYTDILCVWAWIAERKTEELKRNWGETIVLRPHWVNVFGDTARKMATQWKDRGGYDGFAEHVIASAASYDDAPVHPDLWHRVRPATSANAHLVLKAVEIAAPEGAGAQLTEQFATRLRRAFFIDAVDIGKLENVVELTAGLDVPQDLINAVLASGAAMAGLMSDYSQADQGGIKGSPSWVMNNARQILYGNVGYRVLHANVEELLSHPEQEASWCG